MNKSNGFTLVELVVMLAIAALLLGVGVPSMQSYLANQRVTAVMNGVASGFNLARSAAVDRRQMAGVCASSDGNSCGGVTDWARGWLVWVDSDDSGAYSPGVDEIIRVNQIQEAGVQVTGALGQVTYSASGLISPMLANMETLLLCKPGAAIQGVVRVMPSGQVITTREDSAC